MNARGQGGYAMAALLAGLTLTAVLAASALPVYSQVAKREREVELIFRGKQYARAIELYQRRFPNMYPPTVERLLELRLLRTRYRDPVSQSGEFDVIRTGVSRIDLTTAAGRVEAGLPSSNAPVFGGVAGVVSQSKEASILTFNGSRHYNEWVFVARAPAVNSVSPVKR